MIFSNENINNIYKTLLERNSNEEANYILSNSLAILGDKKIIPSKELSEHNIKRINSYKYPDRLEAFINTTLQKSEIWKQYSFVKFVFSE